MSMDQADIEGTVDAAYRSAGFETDEPAAPLALARRLLGISHPVRRAHGLLTNAALARVHSEWRIYLRHGLSDRARDWLVSHELGEWLLTREGYSEGDSEEMADRIGAALRAPRKAFSIAARSTGANWAELADAFGTSESSAALRWGEVVGDPLALIAPRRPVRVRGAAWTWPAEPTLRRLARTRGKPLVDDPRRIVVQGA